MTSETTEAKVVDCHHPPALWLASPPLFSPTDSPNIVPPFTYHSRLYHPYPPPPLAAMVRGSDILLIIIAIIFPPAAAAFITGCSCDLLINILLTLLVRFSHHPCLSLAPAPKRTTLT